MVLASAASTAAMWWFGRKRLLELRRLVLPDDGRYQPVARFVVEAALLGRALECLACFRCLISGSDDATTREVP